MGKTIKNVLVMIVALIIIAGAAAGGYALSKKLIDKDQKECEHVYEDGICIKCGEKNEDGEKKEIKTKLLFEDKNSGVVLNSEISEVMTFALADKQPEEEDSVTITVKTTPEGANPLLNYALSFVDSSSEWAEGETVTDYVMVEPISDGSATVKVSCLQPFGERIKLTCSTRDSIPSKLSASCFIDYKQKYLGSYGINLTAGNGEAMDYSASSSDANHNIVSNLVDIAVIPNFDDEICFSVSLSPVFTIPLEGTVSFSYQMWGNSEFNTVMANETQSYIRVSDNDNTCFEVTAPISSLVKLGMTNEYRVAITDKSIETYFSNLIGPSCFSSGKTFREVYDDFCRGSNYFCDNYNYDLLEYQLNFSITIDGQDTYDCFDGAISFNQRTSFSADSLEFENNIVF